MERFFGPRHGDSDLFVCGDEKTLEFAGRMIAGMRVTFVSQVTEAGCAMCSVCVCVRVCVCVCGYVLGYELVHMYPGQHRHSTNPIWLSQEGLLRAPTHTSIFFVRWTRRLGRLSHTDEVLTLTSC